MTKGEIIKYIRDLKADDYLREPCFMCGRWRSITHCHHVLSVSALADLCIGNNWHPSWLPIAYVWLCPNHHEWFHRFNDKWSDETRKKELLLDMTREELTAYNKLLQMGEYVGIEMSVRAALVECKDFREQMAIMEDYLEAYKPQKFNLIRTPLAPKLW
jgi:hypothetical protein